MIRREYESLQRKKSGELALKTTKKLRKQKEKNHKLRDGTAQSLGGSVLEAEVLVIQFLSAEKIRQQPRRQPSIEHAFLASNNKSDMNWLLNSVASSHMSLFVEELTDLKPLKSSI